MKIKLILLSIFVLFIGTVAIYHYGTAQAKECGTCSATGTCTACKSCKYCKNCNENKGTCSVCK